MDILKVENLTKIYGKGENSFKALDNVSFSVKRGQFVAIVGPSGSGKSTLLHLIGGVDRPDGGHVYVDGNDVYARNGGRADLSVLQPDSGAECRGKYHTARVNGRQKGR